MHTHHGGRLADARVRFGGEACDWLDLSVGINPEAWAPPSPPEVDWRALPDPAALAELERAAAQYFGVPLHLCLAVPGSEAGLRALGQVLRLPGEHLPLCYGTHIEAFAATPERGGASVLVIGNPNNPDGALTSREAMLEALARQEAGGGWLVVDEAFVDCAREWSVADLVADNRRLIVTRSFGKFFGLAGVRLGFVLAPTVLLARLRQLFGEWPVCAAALSFGIAAYNDVRWIARTRAALPAAARDLDALLLEHGLQPSGACPLFRLVEAPDAHGLFTDLAGRHILTRPFANHPHLLRFGLPPNPQALARLGMALARG
ncbi:aminotransferase class I/II-fold pyridoxal phosphate-dependent enzyme [Novosphingobium sp. 9U]|uniref:aminotransferase class I/II-fold pyridoxal phosphate-dependent enzyme n=1 Tax=Novosphingobium sp. 9U TaxID=2653158 RepID=UPI0012EFC9DE|nr:aminotransferase class I/II-fold pyridoxal phosphate-dependent enzyme [Novosphingobium sp. 9U]VWX54263.1 L-threonine 3-O-phosphate decarboxylase [Novosphingobium sp. 9U]